MFGDHMFIINIHKHPQSSIHAVGMGGVGHLIQ